MNSFVDDPRLTAYALGEIDEAERAEVESLLKRSPDARRWVESVQQTSARLSAELKTELLVTGYELRQKNYELQITNDELQIDRAAVEVSEFEAGSNNGESRAIRAPSASAGLEESTDSQTNRSLALPALKGRRFLRLLPFALAASVAVASGVTYVTWREFQSEKVARLNSNINLHQIGHGLGQYRYNDSPTIPTIVLNDSAKSEHANAGSNMRTGLVQVDGNNIWEDLNGDGCPELLNGMPFVVGAAEMVDFDPYDPETDADVGSAVRTDPIDSNAVTPTGTLVLSNSGLQCGSGPSWTAETGMTETHLKLNCDPITTEPTPIEGMAVAPITGDESVTFSEGVTARVINSSAVAMNRPQVVGMPPGRSVEAITSSAELGKDAVFGTPLVHGAVETMDYDPGNTGAVSPESFALAVDSLDGINDSGRLSGARFTSGGYDAIGQQAVGGGRRTADSSPQIGLKAKPNMDLREAAVRSKMYDQQRGALIEVPAPGNGQSIFGGSGGGEEESFPDHASYNIKVPKGQYGSITARDQAQAIRSIADVEALQSAVGGAPPKDGNGLPYDPSHAQASTVYRNEEMSPILASQNRDNSANDAGTNVTSGYGSKHERDLQYIREHQKPRVVTWSISPPDASPSEAGIADDLIALSSQGNASSAGSYDTSIEDITIRGSLNGSQAAVPGSFAGTAGIGGNANSELKGDPFFGGNWLTGGNIDGTHVVSVEDYGVIVTTSGATEVIDLQFVDLGSAATTLNSTTWSVSEPYGLNFVAPNSGFSRKHIPHTASSVDPTTAESYDPVIEIPFLFVENQPLSTFSIDVDTASYTNVRRMLNQNVLPPHGAVRVEEMINYFDYDYPPPTGADPFSVNVAVAECPWNPEHRLARIGIKGKVFNDRNRPAANLVFLVDVSGSMQDANKLPLVRHGLRRMVEQLTPRDSVAIVTYADGTNVALQATSARNKQTILNAIDRLMSGGGTNGGAGIETAYQLANEHYVEGGANRVILATDGDFNVGVTRQDELVSMIEEKAATGVFLSVLGFGMGNIKDSMLEKLADKGNGLYAYIDDDVEAERVLVDQMGGTLITIAKDVKIQVEFNPAEVGAYRLIGYENRMLRAQDFNNDAKDAGEIGAGHTVTALYEIVPAGMQAHEPGVDPLKYQGGVQRASAGTEVPDGDTDMVEADDYESAEEVEDAESVGEADDTKATEPRPQGSGQGIVDGRDFNAADGGSADPPYAGELMTVKLRYKDPEGDVSKLIELPVKDEGLTIDDASDDFVFAASVASFGMLLRGSAHSPGLTFDSVLEMAKSSMGEDPFGYREEFIQLVEKAKALSTTNQK